MLGFGLFTAVGFLIAPMAMTLGIGNMPINSRNKGKVGELELAAFLKERGFPEARRGQQYHGGGDSPDVVVPGLEELHLECKRVEAGSLYKWLAQAKRDAAAGKIPVVAHRKNREEWVAILPLSDLLTLMLGKG